MYIASMMRMDFMIRSISMPVCSPSLILLVRSASLSGAIIVRSVPTRLKMSEITMGLYHGFKYRSSSSIELLTFLGFSSAPLPGGPCLIWQVPPPKAG